MKSTMFMLWLATAVLSYGSKIPYIRKIITVLSLMYGRTTIWKVLVKLRKAFIMFNAVIGVYMVFKTVGFSYDNLLAGFVGMGHSYLEIFTNFTKRMFHWFVELFDYKVIPNVPGDNVSGTGNAYNKIWSSGPLDKTVYHPQNIVPSNVEDSLRKSYNSLFNINVEPTPTSWYRDLPSWLWIGGILAGGAVTIGTVFILYKFIQDPLFIANWGNVEGRAGTDVANAAAANLRTTVTPATPEGAVEESLAFKITRKVVRGVFRGVRKLNPSYWFLTSTDTAEQAREFLTQQATTNRLEDLYPYTQVNPHDSWIRRMRLYYLGETSAEIIDRKSLAKSWINEMSKHAHVVPENVASGSGTTLQVTPHVATVGLGLTLDQGFQSVAEKYSLYLVHQD